MFIRDFSSIETKDGLIFTVRGNHDIEDIIRTSFVYLPTKLISKRIRRPNRGYFKIPDETGCHFLASNLPQHLYQHPITKETYPVVKRAEIYRLIDPIIALENILRENEYPELTEFVLHLETIGIKRENIGIFGSVMLGFEQMNFHDFDIIIYGVAEKEKYMESRKKFFFEFAYQSISDAELENITKKIAIYANPIGHGLMHPVSINRQLSCMTKNGALFSVKFGYLPKETVQYLSYPPLTEVELEATVVDDSGGSFIPYTYIVESEKQKYTIQTNSFAYFSAAFNGQKVKIFGIQRDCPTGGLITLSEPHHYISPMI